MSRFIQPLECRTLYSATPVSKATLLADEATVVADGAAAKASLAALVADVSADNLAIQADLKGLPKSNLALFHKLKADEAKFVATIRKDLNAVLLPATALSRKSVNDAAALMGKSTAALQAKVGADVAALGTVTDGPVARLQADMQGGAVDADLQSLVSANPSAANLATDVGTQQSDMSADGDMFSQAIVTFQADLGVLASDVAAAPPAVGSSNGSTIPNLVGTFAGSATSTAGNHVGRISALQVVFTTEGKDGTLSGTLTITDNGQTNSLMLTGTVTAGHTFSATVTDPSGSQNGATLTGTVTGNAIVGAYVSTGDSGTFTIARQ